MTRDRDHRYGPVLKVAGIAVLAFGAGGVGAAMSAEVPIPRPKPSLSAEPAAAERPIEAIDRLVGVDSDVTLGDPTESFASPVTGYAPPSSLAPRSRFPTNVETPLRVTAHLSQDSDAVIDGVQWRVFGELPDREGKLPLIASASGGDAEFTLRPGRYLVHAGFGRAGQAHLVEVDVEPKTQTFVLDAGGVRLDATLGGGGELQPALLKFEIYRRDPENPSGGYELVTTAEPGKIVALAAGAYHIVSSYGGVNALRTADLVIEPGKLTTVTMEHGATGVTLKLVSEAGGEAIADTSWVVRDQSEDGEGTEIFAGVGAFPSMVLANGTYVVEARHRGRTFTREFVAEGGTDREIEVLAAQ